MLGGEIMKIHIFALLLAFVGCYSRATLQEVELVPPERLTFSEPWAIGRNANLLPYTRSGGNDSTTVGSRVTLDPGFHLGELGMLVRLEPIRFDRKKGELYIVGTVFERQTEEPIPGVTVFHLRPDRPSNSSSGETIVANVVDSFVTDRTGHFGGIVVPLRGDILAFEAVGFFGTFCALDPVDK
jgi:hypothetical protein